VRRGFSENGECSDREGGENRRSFERMKVASAALLLGSAGAEMARRGLFSSEKRSEKERKKSHRERRRGNKPGRGYLVLCRVWKGGYAGGGLNQFHPVVI